MSLVSKKQMILQKTREDLERTVKEGGSVPFGFEFPNRPQEPTAIPPMTIGSGFDSPTKNSSTNPIIGMPKTSWIPQGTTGTYSTQLQSPLKYGIPMPIRTLSYTLPPLRDNKTSNEEATTQPKLPPFHSILNELESNDNLSTYPHGITSYCIPISPEYYAKVNQTVVHNRCQQLSSKNQEHAAMGLILFNHAKTRVDQLTPQQQHQHLPHVDQAPKSKKMLLTRLQRKPSPSSTVRKGRRMSASNTDQKECCVKGCSNDVSNRLRFSLRTLEMSDFKEEHIKNEWNKVCPSCYFSDLYRYKKANGSGTNSPKSNTAKKLPTTKKDTFEATTTVNKNSVYTGYDHNTGRTVQMIPAPLHLSTNVGTQPARPISTVVMTTKDGITPVIATSTRSFVTGYSNLASTAVNNSGKPAMQHHLTPIPNKKRPRPVADPNDVTTDKKKSHPMASAGFNDASLLMSTTLNNQPSTEHPTIPTKHLRIF